MIRLTKCSECVTFQATVLERVFEVIVIDFSGRMWLALYRKATEVASEHTSKYPSESINLFPIPICHSKN